MSMLLLGAVAVTTGEFIPSAAAPEAFPPFDPSERERADTVRSALATAIGYHFFEGVAHIAAAE